MKKIRYLPIPKSFHFQWHITDKCNLKCSHCYRNENIENELSTEEIFRIIESYAELIKAWGMKEPENRISLTGGEPVLRKDFFQILKKLSEYRDSIQTVMMSNGTLISEQDAIKMRDYGVRSIQVSIEGEEENNDKIRGSGTYKKIIRSFEILKSAGMSPTASLTLSKANLDDIEGVAEECRKAGASFFRISRLVPIGKGEEMKSLLITPYEYRDVLRKMHRINSMYEARGYSFRLLPGCSSPIWETDGMDFRIIRTACSCGFNSLTMLPNGDVVPCRRLPVILGNIREKSLFEIFYGSPVIWNLRNINKINSKCKSCSYYEKCGGPAKCMSSAYFNNPFAPDPNCWNIFSKMPEKDEFPEEPEICEFATSGRFFNFSSENFRPARKSALPDTGRKKIEVSIFDMEKLADEIENKGKYDFFFRLSENDLKPETGDKILRLLRKLKENGLEINVCNPIPRCVTGLGNLNAARSFGMPESCSDCSEFFGREGLCKYIKEAGIAEELLDYMTKKQMLEYIMISKGNYGMKKCSSCLWKEREICDAKCL